jgi:hypothetical protein
MRTATWLALAPVVVLAVSAGVLATPALAGPTPTIPHTCPSWTANVARGRVGQIIFDSQTGREVTAVAVADGRLSLGRPYKALANARIEYEGNSYAARAGTEFALSCYGQSASNPTNLNGAVYLQSGVISVNTVSDRPGGIKTFEALMNPVGATAQLIAVSRALTRGGGRVGMRATGPEVDITPELGSSAGHCIYHEQVRLTSTFSQRLQTFLLSVTIIR